MEMAELRRDADNVAILPKARIALPVFWLGSKQEAKQSVGLSKASIKH